MTLRNRLHVQNPPAAVPQTQTPSPPKGATPQTVTSTNVTPVNVASIQPVVPPRTTTTATVPAVTTQPSTVTTSTAEVRQINQQCTGTGGELEDLIHLQGPLTEDAVMKCLQARFNSNNFYVSNCSFLVKKLYKTVNIIALGSEDVKNIFFVLFKISTLRFFNKAVRKTVKFCYEHFLIPWKFTTFK